MSSWPDRTDAVVARTAAALVLLACAATLAQAQQDPAASYAGIGRPATAKEIQAWDIDVRPDFKGLPKGSGSVATGMEVWEGKCAACHGVFGESNEFFTPIVGGTTAADIKTGHVARLTDSAYPGRTTLMKLFTLSTLWDYIDRAMPWTQPKSLTKDEVYAVTAYILNMGGIVPDDFVLSDRNIAETQERLPNRNGGTTAHALWPGAGFGVAKPDVVGSNCMNDCGPAPKVISSLPLHARNAHGNLALQNRLVGAELGADTTRPPGEGLAGRAASSRGAAPAAPAMPAASAAAATSGADTGATAFAMAQQHACVACHAIDSRLVGPSFREIAKKVATRSDAVVYLSGKIKSGGSGVWGSVPMPAQSLGDADATAIAQWLAHGAKQ